MLGFILLVAASGADAQSRKSLEGKRKKLLQDIKIANQLLKTTTRNKETTLNRLYTLQSQINKREELVHLLTNELLFVDSNIVRTTNVVVALNEDIDALEKEYSEMARQAYRQKMNNSRLLFIFSSDGFNQAFRRWQYIKQYDRFRAKQTELILLIRATLSSKIELLESQKNEKETLLAEAEKQTALLVLEKKDKNKIISALKKDEKRIRKDITKKQRSHQNLNDAIEDVIRSEIALNRKQARNPKAQRKGSSKKQKNVNKRPEIIKLTNSFSSNRGRLPWPVKKGIITGHFGNQPHPTIKSIQITNNGIDIQTSPGAKAKAVYKGEVAGVQFIPGHHYMVMIKHGDYYTVYSNIETTSLKKGDWIKTNQPIGRLSIDDQSNTSKVHFEVWKNKERMNPVKWIRR